MSDPQNILAKYRSYSYHHILIACDNEAAAEYIRTSNRLSTFRDLSLARPVRIDEEGKLQAVDRRDEASGEINQTDIGNFVVVLNGMIDTSFVVKEVEWFSATAANAEALDAFTSLAVEGRMTIEEPRGVRFLNALNGACDLLQSDPSGVIWMLKTIFIGHNDNGESSDYITDLRPLEFMMYDVTGTFSITGGLYEISFAGAANGAARYPQFSRIAKQINIPLEDGRIETALKFLEDKMNTLSSTNRTCVIEALQKAYPTVDSSQLNEFREVQYAIELDQHYISNAAEYKVDTLTNQEKDTANEEDSGGTIKMGPQSTVEQAIRSVMNRSRRVLKDRTEGDEEGLKYIYKIHSEITMVGKGGQNPITNSASEKNIVTVVFRVRRHAEFTNQTVERVLAGEEGIQGEPPEVTKQKIEENTINFDYFFTGKNIDIIDFDLKMDMGLAFLQTIASTNNLGTGTFQISGSDTEPLNADIIVPRENTAGGGNDPAVSTEGEKQPKILVRPKTPIFPATNVNNVFSKNVRGALDSELFNAFLSRHAALESIEAKVTIHGNPYLMSQTNRKPSDTQRRGNTTERAISDVMSNWEYMPGLAKVNIFMPATNDTPSDRDVFNRERFWYDGYYYIYGIDHKFSDGTFTQDLHLLSLPTENLLEETQNTDITVCGTREEEGAEGAAAGLSGEGQVKISESKASNQRDKG